MKLDIGVESFLEYCEEASGIANEADLRYKSMRLMQTNIVALNKQVHDQRNICEKKLAEANSPEELDSFEGWLNKQEKAIQRKINGKEIKHKDTLRKFISLYNEYRSKIKSKRSTLPK